MWVRSEYAGELAVVAAWLAALLPWSVSVVPQAYGLVVIRFVFFRVQYVTGASLSTNVSRPFLFVFQMPGFHGTADLVTASEIWLAGAGVVALAVALSVVYYGFEERVEASPVDPVRLMGGLLVVGALVHTVSLYLFFQAQPTYPVGVVLMWVLAAVLLGVERTDGSPDPAT
ncbi:MAG: hypothetical protein ABEI96_06640 [Haloarculaceae archaeon]